MSERVGLGVADGDSRWVGVRRHQAVLIITGLGLSGEWLIRPRSTFAELLLGVLLLLGATPVGDGLTVAEFSIVVLRYLGRSRWSRVSVEAQPNAVQLEARGRVNVRGFELRHRGRLDLCGLDVQGARDLAAVANALATNQGSAHVSVHVRSSANGAATLLTLSDGASPPDGWSENAELILDVVGLAPTKSSMWLLERWRYLRSTDEVIRVLRVGDFTAAAEGRALLEGLQQSRAGVTVGLHFEVVARTRAQRIAERAVHRVGSDGAISRAAGFRRTSRAERSLERLSQREVLVASGRALLRLAVYVTVRASSVDQLREGARELTRRAREAGVRCEGGFGRQAIWYCHQLPGGPGW
jgi:hypothetical protein